MYTTFQEICVVVAAVLFVAGVFYAKIQSQIKNEESRAILAYHLGRFDCEHRPTVVNTSTQLYALSRIEDLIIDGTYYHASHVSFSEFYDVKTSGGQLIIVGDVDATEIPSYGAGICFPVLLNPDPWKLSLWGISSFQSRSMRLLPRGEAAHVTVLKSFRRKEPRHATLEELAMTE